MADRKAIIIARFNTGGIADSKYMGIPNSVAKMVGFDIHSEPGVLNVNQKLTKESGATVDGFVKKILPCSDGNTYLFDSLSGKVWKRTSAGSYSLVATLTPAAGAAGVCDAREYNGYIYYAMESRLGRVAVASPVDWSARNDNWQTFTNTDANNHPMIDQNSILYIGQGNLLSEVNEAGTFTASALDLPVQYTVSSLGKIDTDVLIGTYIDDNINLTSAFRWNTWSVSWSGDDPIREIGINAFIDCDNFLLVNAGKRGNLYSVDGYKLNLKKRIPGLYSTAKQGKIYPNAVANLNGLPLLGFSNIQGNPAPQGVYSYGNLTPDYNKVLNLEFPISEVDGDGRPVLEGIEIGAMAVVGEVILVSWRIGSSYGVDKLDTSNKVPVATLETRVMNIQRFQLNRYIEYAVHYESLPANTSIKLFYKKNHADTWTEFTMVDDTIRKRVYAELDLDGAGVLQLKMEAWSDGNNAPKIEDITIFTD